jgi:hypothetical protein
MKNLQSALLLEDRKHGYRRLIFQSTVQQQSSDGN